jgi:hypothetical protein
MAKIYKSITDKNGSRMEKSLDSLDYKNKTIEKSVTILSGSGEWKNLHGNKLFIDPAGVCIKGPDIYISRKWEDLQRLSFNDVNTVALSVARATMFTNKSYEDSIDKKKRKEEYQKAVKFLDEAIERNNKNYQRQQERQNFN